MCQAEFVESVTIGLEHEGLRLVLDPSDPIVETMVAELRSNGLKATRTVVHSYSTGFADLAHFFAGLAQDWRGWDGPRVWESLEGDLVIEARHEYGHVQLRVTLRAEGSRWGNNGWRARADLTMDAGEQLSQVAADLAQMTRFT